MAFSMGAGNGRSSRRRPGAMAEINIVPLVDVVLVLLVIFMLTAHVTEFGLEVDVPKVRTVESSSKELPVISISRVGELQLNENPVKLAALGDEIRQRFPGAKEVYLRADGKVVWDALAQVVSELGEAKFKVNMVTQQDDTGRPLRRR